MTNERNLDAVLLTERLQTIAKHGFHPWSRVTAAMLLDNILIGNFDKVDA